MGRNPVMCLDARDRREQRNLVSGYLCGSFSLRARNFWPAVKPYDPTVRGGDRGCIDDPSIQKIPESAGGSSAVAHARLVRLLPCGCDLRVHDRHGRWDGPTYL